MVRAKFVFFLSCGLLMASIAPVAFSQQAGDVYMWNFNEGKGSTVTDDSGKFTANLGLIFTEDEYPQTTADSPSGKSGDLSLVPGSGVYVDDSNSPILNILDGPITIEAWVKLTGLNSTNDIVSYGDTYKIGVNNGYFVWTFRTIEDVSCNIAIDADQTWHHIAMSWNPGVEVNFFFDGKLADTVATTSAFRDAQFLGLNIGSGANGGSPFPGLIDRVRIHHALLDASQLDSVAGTPKAALADTLVAFNFDETKEPFISNVSVERSGTSVADVVITNTAAHFSSDTPTGKSTDYSLYFDGNDRVTFTDTEDILQFYYEDFTFETWVKFNPEEQTVTRPILFAYGIGGQNGYSFSIQNAVVPRGAEESPSGQSGDRSVKANSGLVVSDANGALKAIQSGPITFECWAKTDDVSSTQDFFRYGNSIKCGLNNGNFVFTLLGLADYLSDASFPADDAWHHVAMVWDPNSGVTFYLDGADMGTVATSGVGRDLQNTDLVIGASHTGTSPFAGYIDRFRIHSAILSASQLDTNAASAKAALSSTLVDYEFNELAVPYENAVGTDFPAINRTNGPTVVVTTYGIIDAISTDAVIPSDGRWHQVAAAHEMGVEFRYFVDGKLLQTTPYVDGVEFAEVYDFLLGSEASGGNPYVGYMDRVKITRGALNEGDLDYFVPVSVENWPLY